MNHSSFPRIRGLVAATHTPFDADGSLNLAVVEQQAAHLVGNGVGAVFPGGTTGESSSLTLDERRSLAQRWCEVARGTSLRVIIHVGSNCLDDSRTLAAHAEKAGADGIAALSPSYFKPRNVEALVECCARIASAAPATPFYFYDIPSMTGVNLSMREFLAQARERIPNLAGLKFTNADLMSFQQCLHADGGKWDVLWGCDEYLLAALALGGSGAVGSTYNFAAPIYLRLIAAFERGDLATAREEQWRSVQLVQVLAGYGYMGVAKAVMEMLGVPVGPARLPHLNPKPPEVEKLRAELDALGFFGWIGK